MQKNVSVVFAWVKRLRIDKIACRSAAYPAFSMYGVQKYASGRFPRPVVNLSDFQRRLHEVAQPTFIVPSWYLMAYKAIDFISSPRKFQGTYPEAGTPLAAAAQKATC